MWRRGEVVLNPFSITTWPPSKQCIGAAAVLPETPSWVEHHCDSKRQVGMQHDNATPPHPTSSTMQLAAIDLLWGGWPRIGSTMIDSAACSAIFFSGDTGLLSCG